MTTTQFTPTADELHWLATRLTGWELKTNAGYMNDHFANEYGDIMKFTWDWKPHLSRNQSALLVERVGELGLAWHFGGTLDGIVEIYNENLTPAEMFHKALCTTPAQQVQAILAIRKDIEQVLEGQG